MDFSIMKSFIKEHKTGPPSQETSETSLWNTKKFDLPIGKGGDADIAPTLEEAEHRALVDRILRIMRLTYERLQVALLIPHMLMYSQGTADQYISLTDKQTLYKFCDKYLQNEDSSSTSQNEEEIFIDHELIKAIDLVHSNDKFVQNIEDIAKCLPESSKKFLNAMNDLKVLTEIRLKTTANDEIQKEKTLHHICHENEKLERKIEEMKSHIRERDITMQWKIAEKQALIQKFKKELATKKWNNHILIKKEISEANEKMNQIYAKSEDRQKELQEEANKARMAYEKLLQENMQADKKLRAKKARVLNQLKRWIKKYDNDIGNRTREIERLKAELNTKSDEYNKFMEQYDKQEEEYSAILAMRDAEEKKITEEKMLLFMMNRAARLIQRRWRMFRQKKKKPKGKGKKAKK